MNRNIAVYTKIPTPLLTASSTSKTLFELIEAANPGFIDGLKGRKKDYLLNTFRVYVHLGVLGIMLDGSKVTQTNYFGVETAQHFIENCDLNKVQFLGIGDDAVFTLAIAHIG